MKLKIKQKRFNDLINDPSLALGLPAGVRQTCGDHPDIL